MKISVIGADELTADLTAHWRRIQDSCPELASPYFCPEFTLAVAAVRRDVRLAVMEDRDGIAGFFPFQRNRMGAGKPVGGPLSDFHGVIAWPRTQWDVIELLRACRLTSFEFGHLLASQAPFQSYHSTRADSHYMDMSRGFAGYTSGLRRSGSHLLRDIGYKRRRLAREHGDLRFVPHTDDPRVLRALLRWKSEQYRRSGLIDVFGVKWTIALLERIHATQTDGFAGLLSALYVGDRLAAAHLGMRSRTVWNWWFPRHDERFAKCSPGILLRLGAAEAAGELGIERIDLGLGDESTYKPRLSTGRIPLAAGRVERPSLAAVIRKLRRNVEVRVRRSPLSSVLRAPGRLLTRLERQRRFR